MDAATLVLKEGLTKSFILGTIISYRTHLSCTVVCKC